MCVKRILSYYELNDGCRIAYKEQTYFSVTVRPTAILVTAILGGFFHNSSSSASC